MSWKLTGISYFPPDQCKLVITGQVETEIKLNKVYFVTDLLPSEVTVAASAPGLQTQAAAPGSAEDAVRQPHGADIPLSFRPGRRHQCARGHG